MEWIKVINDAIEFMEKNLTEEIGLLEVARSVNISAFHFHHAFTIMTGITPAEYIRNRRLTLAGLELADGSSKIIDIALKYGYETPESFTKAFSRFHGFSPMQVRKGSPLKSMNRYTVRITIDGGTIMEYKIEKWDELDLLVHAKDFHAETSDQEIPAFWDEYFSNETTKKIPGYLGVCAQGSGPGGLADKSDVFKYGIGCRASDVLGEGVVAADGSVPAGALPEGFEIIHIPAYTWAVFKCVGPAGEAISEGWDKIYKEWLPSADYERILDYDIENYLPGDSSAADYVCEICLPVKKKR